MRDAGAKIEVHSDHFSGSTTDEVWLEKVGREGWVVLTSDKNISRRKIELLAVVSAKVKVFIVTSEGLTGMGMATLFVSALEKMKRMAKNTPGPFIARVYKDGSVKMKKIYLNA